MRAKPRILVIDDDSEARSQVRAIFHEEFSISEAENGLEGIKQAIREPPDVVLLDLVMPKLDGFQTCEELRKEKSLQNIPILVVSARDHTSDKVKAFRSGADDYVVKPYDREELRIRVEARLDRFRRMTGATAPEKEGVVRCGNLLLDPMSFHVSVAGREVHLGPIDFRLIRFLAENRGRVCSREEILDAVWDSTDRSVRILDTHILALRKKLEGFDHSIVAVYGSGYILKPISG